MLLFHHLGKGCLIFLACLLLPFSSQAQTLAGVTWPCTDQLNDPNLIVTDIHVDGTSILGLSSLSLPALTTHSVEFYFSTTYPQVSASIFGDVDLSGVYDAPEVLASVTNLAAGPGYLSFTFTTPPMTGSYPLGFFIDPDPNNVLFSPCESKGRYSILNVPDPSLFIIAASDINIQDISIEEMSWGSFDQTHCIKELTEGCFLFSYDMTLDFSAISTSGKFMFKSTMHEVEINPQSNPAPACPQVHQLDPINMTIGCGGFLNGLPQNYVQTPITSYNPPNPFMTYQMDMGFTDGVIPSNDPSSCWNSTALVPLALEERIEIFKVVSQNPLTYQVVHIQDPYTLNFSPYLRKNRLYCNWEEMAWGFGERKEQGTLSFSAPDPMNLAPNPIQESANITYELENKGTVSIRITDLQGRTVQTLLSGVNRTAGIHQERLTLKNLPNGMYVLHLDSPQGRQTRSILKQ
ncbi:MAG: T9SS type A sorting domain-containing protein [Bacteroidota bacterium]